MIEVIICSVIGAVCICGGGGVVAYYKFFRPRDEEVYILDMRDSERDFTFNEIYSTENKSFSKAQI
jgi:hypothetical protein